MGIHPGPIVRIFNDDLYPYQNMHPKQQDILRYVLDKYPEDQFVDHAFYLLHEYDEIIRNYTQSMLLENAYYAKAYRKFYLGLSNSKSYLRLNHSKSHLQLNDRKDYDSRYITEVLNDYYVYLHKYRNGSYVLDSLRSISSTIALLQDKAHVAQELKRFYSKIVNLKGASNLGEDLDNAEKYVVIATQESLINLTIKDPSNWLKHLPMVISRAVNLSYVYLHWARRAFNDRRYVDAATYYEKVNHVTGNLYSGEKLRIKQVNKVVQLAMAHSAGKIPDERYIWDTAMALKATKYDAEHAIHFLKNTHVKSMVMILHGLNY